MITWDNFYLFAVASICLWLTGAIFALRSSVRSRMAVVLTIAGITCLGIFIAGLWISLQRPPLRTMGETRLWYSFFMGIAGLLTYIRWKYRWILSFSTLLSTVFVIINLLKPEIHDQSLMPALQSIWFIPHVTVYMFSYSVLDADDIFIQGLRDWGLYDKVWQAGVILLPVQSVGVMGDERTYERAVALRAVTSTDAMTADWAHLPYEFMGKVSNDIINKVKGVNRVTYDISSKPPATIEWE